MLEMILRISIHYGLHFLAPGFIAKKWYPKDWLKVWGILVATMLVDLDHLLSSPVFDSQRLSIGNHILHSYSAIAIYLGMLFYSRTRLIAIGLLFHMVTDGIDYLWV